VKGTIRHPQTNITELYLTQAAKLVWRTLSL
jgi:hypothetical protein